MQKAIEKTALEVLLDQNNFTLEEVLRLVRLGAKPDVKNSQGKTLLELLAGERATYIAANSFWTGASYHYWKDKDGVVELVQKHGANPNFRNSSGLTPLQAMLDPNRWQWTYLETVMTLVRLGAHPDFKNPQGDSLLHVIIIPDRLRTLYGLQSREEAIVELVKTHKANIEIRNTSNRTPLQVLLDNNRVDFDLAMVLVRAGANANTRNSKGMSLLHLLIQVNNPSKEIYCNYIEELISKYGASTNSELDDAKHKIIAALESYAYAYRPLFFPKHQHVERAINIIRAIKNSPDLQTIGHILVHQRKLLEGHAAGMKQSTEEAPRIDPSLLDPKYLQYDSDLMNKLQAHEKLQEGSGYYKAILEGIRVYSEIAERLSPPQAVPAAASSSSSSSSHEPKH